MRELRVRQEVSDCGEPSATRPSNPRVWRLDSDVEIDLDQPYERRKSPELDLRIPPRSKRVARSQVDSDKHDTAPILSQNVENDQRNEEISDRRQMSKSNKRPVAVRQTDDRSKDRGKQFSRRSRERSVSRRRQTRRSDDQSSRRRKSSRSTCRKSSRRQNDSSRVRNNNSPPSSDDSDSSRDSSDNNRKSVV